jgi:hypothetical protein
VMTRFFSQVILEKTAGGYVPVEEPSGDA